MTTLRPVSGLERLWLAAGRIAPPFAIHLIVEPGRPIDRARWTHAIERVSPQYPGLTARLRGCLGGARWVPSDAAMPIDVVDTPWDGDRPAPFLERSFTGPLMRVALLPERAVFSVHHALTDGRGLWAFVDDVIAALDGRPIRGAVAGPLTDARLAAALGVDPTPPPISDTTAPFPDPPTTRPGITWRRRRLPPGSNVVARVIAAIAATAGRPQRIGVPVDLRRHRPDLRSTANLTGVLHLDVERPDADAIKADLRDALDRREAAGHALAADRVRGLPVGFVSAVGTHLTRRERARGRCPVSATVSSLGRHALTLDGAPVRVLFVPPGAPGLPVFIGLCGSVEGIELSAVSPVAYAGDGRLDALLDALVARC